MISLSPPPRRQRRCLRLPSSWPAWRRSCSGLCLNSRSRTARVLRLKGMAARRVAETATGSRTRHSWRKSIAVDGGQEERKLGDALRDSMKEQIETRIAKLIEAVKKASPKDSSGKPLTGDAL